MKPGLYFDVSAVDYDRVDAIRRSSLQLLMDGKTPAHLRATMYEPEQKGQALDTGQAGHLALLEPDRFDAEVVEMLQAPETGWRSNAAKAEKKAFLEANEGKIIVERGDMGAIRAWRDSVYANAGVREILTAQGRNEATLVWTDEKTGVPCKARPDVLRVWRGYVALGDLKTAADASRDAFRRSCEKFGYAIQAAFYLRGMEALEGKHYRPFLFIVLEKAPPYLAALYEIDPEDLERANAKISAALERFAECKKTGRWPGYPQEVVTLEMSQWWRLGADREALLGPPGEEVLF